MLSPGPASRVEAVVLVLTTGTLLCALMVAAVA